jgi:hypothetical protein
LPLYRHLIHEQEGVADVLAERLRILTARPASLLPPLVERDLPSEEAIVLLGRFDRLLVRLDCADYQANPRDSLRDTRVYNSDRSLFSAIVASRDEPFIAALALRADPPSTTAQSGHRPRTPVPCGNRHRQHARCPNGAGYATRRRTVSNGDDPGTSGSR